MKENRFMFRENDLEKLVIDIKEIANKIWLTPFEMQEEIKPVVKSIINNYDILVTGETNNTSIYIFFEKYVLAISPFSDLRENVLLQRWNKDWSRDIPLPIHYNLFEVDNKLKKMFDMPTVLLVNLCVVENYPIPRLNLSTSSISAFLRYKQYAKVEIIDMQIGHSIQDIVSRFVKLNPDFIGISINFGQKKMAFDVLDQLFEKKQKHSLKSEIVLGNVIPAFSPSEFFEKYPEIIISYREGEYSWCDLVRYRNGEISKNDIDGIMYNDAQDQIVKTITKAVDMNLVPTPSLDTIRDIARLKGALTIETTRGCDYSKCTFCPRDHKLSSWRYLTPEQTLKQLGDILRAGNEFGIRPHLYLADEEFIGEMTSGKEAERIIKICEGIIEKFQTLAFDASARADSVFDPRRLSEWNVERIKMWHYCKNAGLDRLFVGVESGCDRQLKRYGKGTTAYQNVIALRILTALGISIRIGFVMFDQLMTGLNDMKENVEFLERTDVLMKPVDMTQMTYEKLFDLLVNDEKFISENAIGNPVYSVVSYMLASMEVLMGTPYIKIMKNLESEKNCILVLNDGAPDTNMGRYSVKFVDDTVGSIAVSAQKWIDSNFSVMYTVKSLHKVAQTQEKHLLYNYMVQHRQISHYLLRYVINAIQGTNELDYSLKKYLISANFYEEIVNHLMVIQKLTNLDEKLISCLAMWQNLMHVLVENINEALNSKKISDTYDNRLRLSISNWLSNKGKWELINGLQE